MAELKLGKQPAAPRSTDFKFSEFAAAIALPNVPSRFGHGGAYPDWGMLGNDQYGDCVWAGAAHEHMLFNKVVQHLEVPFDPQGVLSDYSAVTGFDPNDPSTDKGTDVHDALSYRRKTGIVDANGARHQIGAYVALEPKNWTHLEQAAYIFGAVGIGIQFPSSAMDQFNAGQPWDVVPGSAIEGGHYVPVVGSVDAPNQASAITWGKRQPFTRAFYEEYNDEAWAYITQEELHDGAGLHGFDMAKLNQFLSALN
ncbi:MAG TPA: hypothetical protein VLJ76_00865 [Gaiellaceae bacterium]|nr:hypothetical protein [Gaiellaceae bacterium]